MYALQQISIGQIKKIKPRNTSKEDDIRLLPDLWSPPDVDVVVGAS